MTQKSNLTIKQDDFALAYVQNKGNATQAYLSSYPGSEKWTDEAVAVEASRLLKNPKVTLRIDVLRANAEQRSAITTDRVLKEEECLAFVDPAELVDDEGFLKPVDQLPVTTRRAIASFKATEFYSMSLALPTLWEIPLYRAKGRKTPCEAISL